MQIYEEIQKQAETILMTLRADGLNLSVTKKATLRSCLETPEIGCFCDIIVVF